MNKPQGFDLVERARALAPLITHDADEIERTRRLTPAVTQALIENGLYRALLPKSLGGTEAPLEAFMQMQEEIAKSDASTAWCLGQCSVCAMVAAYLEPEAANEIFNVAPGILAWGAIAHEVTAVPGGYLASGRWDFASGSRQASWLGAHVRGVGADGTPRRKADGSLEIRTILFPATDATMYDVWDVIGLKGTGTDSYSVDNLFIPEKFSALRDDLTAVRETGTLYKLTTNMVYSMGFAATSLGVAPVWRRNSRSRWRGPMPSRSARSLTDARSSKPSLISRMARPTVERVPLQAGLPGAVSGRQRRQGRKPARSAAAADGKNTTFSDRAGRTGQIGRQ